ncbi:FAD-dependent monooxygenase [Psychromarinibacter sp. C21-152]|uniref:FAD-dependent monooxygenase n=1 Tax=Psychromarinibacter sediminicola TaxID=3033385 RepID=A0AAE3T8F4_9RHOB|nr:FAD-dependent monooxygenase [Psychromarinibacter sediminicola]MDF0599425.1 FAD-dependent monooxygenase [Psychromarinibacter sediminicola]
MKVLVAGAGPTGLTAALELARRGAELRIVEKRPDPSPFSRAVGITRGSMEILRPSGVAEALMAEAVTFSAIAFHVGARPIAHLPMDFDDRSRIWGLPQDRTEAHLAQALRRHGVEVEYGTPVTKVAQDERGVTVRTASDEDRADLLIGADGVGSTVREALGLDFPGYELPETWSIADVESAAWPDPTAFHGYLLPQGAVCVVVPLGPSRFRIIASQPDALAALPVPMQVDATHRAGTFHISVRQVRDYAQGRVFLAGDAAHCHSPVGGRGMNLGIADAADLAARIVEGRTDGYAAARHAASARIMTATERARRLLQGGPLRRGLATSVLRLAAAVPPVGRAFVHRFVGG